MLRPEARRRADEAWVSKTSDASANRSFRDRHRALDPATSSADGRDAELPLRQAFDDPGLLENRRREP